MLYKNIKIQMQNRTTQVPVVKINCSEVQDFCLPLFEINGMPDPDIEWDDFLIYVKDMLDQEDLQWNPIKRQ